MEGKEETIWDELIEIRERFWGRGKMTTKPVCFINKEYDKEDRVCQLCGFNGECKWRKQNDRNGLIFY